jgi:hypothetical protein
MVAPICNACGSIYLDAKEGDDCLACGVGEYHTAKIPEAGERRGRYEMAADFEADRRRGK